MLLNLQIFGTRIGNNGNIPSFPEGNNDGDFCGHLREAHAQMVCLLLAHSCPEGNNSLKQRSLILEGCGGHSSLQGGPCPCSGLFLACPVLFIWWLHHPGPVTFFSSRVEMTGLSNMRFWLVSLSQATGWRGLKLDSHVSSHQLNQSLEGQKELIRGRFPGKCFWWKSLRKQGRFSFVPKERASLEQEAWGRISVKTSKPAVLNHF